ncbi:MAG: glycosyltransferase family 2 protein [Sideroxydans sp.]|nr:glycosyltransferase family 2 protein [Sideroxydans sp.]
MKKIATLLTCHNRKAKTLACLEALFQNTLHEGYSLDVFLVDDGSTDGTEQAVLECYPQVNIIKGDGNLFWCGGMRLAFAAAMKINFDMYLLLNDDTKLNVNAIKTLLESYANAEVSAGRPVMVVGSVVDPITNQLTYGGRVSRGWKQPLYYDFVPALSTPVVCDTANANCLLIPSEIASVVGNLDSTFLHGKADYDYGLRAKKKGFSTFVACEIVGECSHNPPEDISKFIAMNIAQRWRYLTSPKQFPVFEWLVYTWRHAGVFWFIHWLRPYRKLFLKSLRKDIP